MVLLLGRTSSEAFVVLVVVVVHSFLFFILLLFFICCCSSFISRLLYHVTSTPPWLLRPVKASTSSELYPDYFWLPFLFHLPWALRFWKGIFYTQAFFTLRSFHWHFTCAYQGFPGNRQFFLEVCRDSCWYSKHRPGPSVCLIHNNPQSSNSEKFIFKFYQISSWIAWGEKLIYLLLTRFKLFLLVQSCS